MSFNDHFVFKQADEAILKATENKSGEGSEVLRGAVHEVGVSGDKGDVVTDEELRSTCKYCQTSYNESLLLAFKDEQLRCQGMWLHALKYEVIGKVFQVPEPSWVHCDM